MKNTLDIYKKYKSNIIIFNYATKIRQITTESWWLLNGFSYTIIVR